MALPGLIRDSPAIAGSPAVAHILPLQTDHLHRLAATALARVLFAPFTNAVLAAPAKNPIALFNGQHMHRGQLRAAATLSRMVRHVVALAVILAVADIIKLALVSRDDHPGCRNDKQRSHRRYKQLFHTQSSLHTFPYLYI